MSLLSGSFYFLERLSRKAGLTVQPAAPPLPVSTCLCGGSSQRPRAQVPPGHLLCPVLAVAGTVNQPLCASRSSVRRLSPQGLPLPDTGLPFAPGGHLSALGTSCQRNNSGRSNLWVYHGIIWTLTKREEALRQSAGQLTLPEDTTCCALTWEVLRSLPSARSEHPVSLGLSPLLGRPERKLPLTASCVGPGAAGGRHRCP
ncbi:unnamed protein product [Rangifer tarandus platyrhynchus]|uniref:Uncharacterized protein n=1 Tax=Rangifer tarandus platyrhynchus TaxID=3082113 RepID=A0ABN8Y9D0_RANTA|nr:unnamed protein product [Rangifer tarandus platyrhynchus]